MESNAGNHKGNKKTAKKSQQALKSASNGLSRVNPSTGQRIANTESETFKTCAKLIAEMTKHPSAQYFINFASSTMNTEIIKEPIDLTILNKRLTQGYYLDLPQFEADTRKIWENSWSINKPGTDIYIATTNISNYFESLIKDIGQTQPKRTIKTQKSQESKTDLVSRIDTTKNNKPMTIQEKNSLRTNIMRITPDKVQGLIAIIQSAVDTSKSKGSLEFNIDKLPIEMCRELERYVNNCVDEKSTKESIPSGHRPTPVVTFIK